MGGGTGSIYAPVFPKHLTRIGFWDDSFFADVQLHRLFTALVLSDGKPVTFQSRVLDWRPDRLLLEHISDDVRLLETRVVLPCHCWVSRLDVVKAVRGPIDVVLWSLQDVDPSGTDAPWQSVTDVDIQRGFLQFKYETAWPTELEPDRAAVEVEMTQSDGQMGTPLPLYITLGADKVLQNRTVQQAQRHDDSPIFETSLLPGRNPQHLQGSGLLADNHEPSLLHLYLTYRVEEKQSIHLCASVGLAPESSIRGLEEALARDSVSDSEKSWRSYFAGVPQFTSSDPFLTNAYWYRWYGLRLNTVSIPNLPIAGSGHTFSPFVTEGVGFFRNFVTYSAQAHLREVVWMHDSTLTTGIFENLSKVQQLDGSFPGHNYSCRPARDFYHADFATSFDLMELLHGPRAGKPVAEALAKYLNYFVLHRQAKDQSGFLVFDQNETGQEYMNRYLFANAQADNWQSFRIVGVEATLYVLRLARLIRSLGLRYRRQDWTELADCVEFETKTKAYDAEESFLRDRLEDGTPSPAHPATGLYALTERAFGHSVDDEKKMIERWIARHGVFRERYGFFAEASSEPTFSSEGVWKGKRLNCPWNGRSWPMANSHILDQLGAASRRHPEYRKLAADSLMGCIRMMFHEADPGRPNSYEHYDPSTGVPALYRGYDDYMHSWIVDLIMRYVVGYDPDTRTFDPLAIEGVDWIECHAITGTDRMRDVRIVNGEVV